MAVWAADDINWWKAHATAVVFSRVFPPAAVKDRSVCRRGVFFGVMMLRRERLAGTAAADFFSRDARGAQRMTFKSGVPSSWRYVPLLLFDVAGSPGGCAAQNAHFFCFGQG